MQEQGSQGEIEATDKVGSVTAERYAQIVAELREVVENQTRGQFRIGDLALEVEPMRGVGGDRSQAAGDELFSVKASLFRLSEDIGVSYRFLEDARWTCSRWPKDQRQAGVSFTVFRVLAAIAGDGERFEAVRTPPPKKGRWTVDDAKRRVGRQVTHPVTVQEKVSAIHSLAADQQVAATVTGDLLRRPEVASQVSTADKVAAVEEFTREAEVAVTVAPALMRSPAVVDQVSAEDKVRVVQELTRDEQVANRVAPGLMRRPSVAFRAMADDGARHEVNRAQVEHGRQAREQFQETSPLAPVVKKIDRSVEFLELVTGCHAFVSAVGRALPGLRDRQLNDDEQAVLRERIAACRATLDWMETAVDTGRVDMDSELARLLQGE